MCRSSGGPSNDPTIAVAEPDVACCARPLLETNRSATATANVKFFIFRIVAPVSLAPASFFYARPLAAALRPRLLSPATQTLIHVIHDASVRAHQGFECGQVICGYHARPWRHVTKSLVALKIIAGAAFVAEGRWPHRQFFCDRVAIFPIRIILSLGSRHGQEPCDNRWHQSKPSTLHPHLAQANDLFLNLIIANPTTAHNPFAQNLP